MDERIKRFIKSKEGYEYPVISPEEIGNTISTVQLTYYPGGAILGKHPLADGRNQLSLCNPNFPELGEWKIATLLSYQYW
jgi:hypothetical protein